MAKLYIVPTPIGNLDDITIRAVRVLSEVDFILAEDTRTSSVLLKHLGIEKKMYAHHKFNEHATVGLVADNIAQGRSAALISDAGTPGISDPGFLLVRACLDVGFFLADNIAVCRKYKFIVCKVDLAFVAGFNFAFEYKLAQCVLNL